MFKQAAYSIVGASLLLSAKAAQQCNLQTRIDDLCESLTSGPGGNCLSTSLWGGNRCIYSSGCTQTNNYLTVQSDDGSTQATLAIYAAGGLNIVTYAGAY